MNVKPFYRLGMGVIFFSSIYKSNIKSRFSLQMFIKKEQLIFHGVLLTADQY